MSSLPFHPLINEWFTETYGKPTPVQDAAWPLIMQGEHVLAIAPTGSGKTLTAFLAALSRFADGSYPADRLSVLYVSPLKALNEDLRRNLTLPLLGIQHRFEEAGEEFPAVRAETRSGDTPQSERRRFLARPPSILALTPESLGILLLNPRGREVLSHVRYVILDEIHTALGSKRGSFLSCQIDRLSLAAGDFQRVALSATVKSPEAAADFAGGLLRSGGGYQKRPVRVVAPNDKKEIEFQVLFPDSGEEADDSEGGHYGRRYAELVRYITGRVKANKSGNTILVFTDSRRRAERLNFLLNKAAEDDNDLAGRPLSYTHHGSLSKDVRRAVEKALVSGEIACVVATGSLELGIDIGGVEEVILAGSPGSASQALQRLGRSGHGVGRTSRGALVPFHGSDLLQAAAVSGAVADRELEESVCVENPLDILAQVILALCTEREWNEDALYETIRGFYVFRNLSREAYDRVTRMLCGAYEGTRLRELKRQLFRDDETKTLNAAPGALILLYTSGGVIASRGYYSLRLAGGGAGAGTKIGELDEEFVWERRIGDCFDFGNRSWKITAIGDEAVEAVPLPGGIDYAPFWKGEPVYRGDVLSRRMLEILDEYNNAVRQAAGLSNKSDNKSRGAEKADERLPGLSIEAKNTLDAFISAQKAFQGKIPLPGLSFIPVEIIDDPAGRGDSLSVIFHSFRGGAVNYPLSLALACDIEKEYGLRVEGAANDNSFLLRLPRSLAADPALCVTEALARLCRGGKGEKRFRERLESSGVFGAAFREAAERSLLLPRSPYGKRIPLWALRQRAKRLFDAVSSYRDFPVTAEAWRTCLRETFNMEGFSSLLEDVRLGSLSFGFFKTRKPSPFSKELAWDETNTLMYIYDERPDLLGAPSKKSGEPSLLDTVIEEAIGNAAARPALNAELIAGFCSRLRREIPGWAPEDALSLCEWVKERIAIPRGGAAGKKDEWETLLECIPPELAAAWQEDKSLGGKLLLLKRKGAGTEVVLHREWAKKWEKARGTELAACLGQWLRYEGPVPVSRIEDIFGLSSAEAEEAVRALSEQGELVRDVCAAGGGGADNALVFTGKDLVCDRENLELLLRLGRRKQRPEVKEREARFLVPFLARRQGLLPGSGGDNAAPWEHLAGIAAPAGLWETEFFPCRSPSFSGEAFDREIREGRLIWYGAGKEKVSFCGAGDLDLVLPSSPPPGFSGRLPGGFFDTVRSFWEIKDALGASEAAHDRGETNGGIDDTAKALWEEVWRGSLSADSWEPLRKAVENGFRAPGSELSSPGGNETRFMRGRPRRLPRAVKERWRAGAPVRGNWFSLSPEYCGEAQNPAVPDILEEEELNRERVRLLLDRWGILCRPLLEREVPALSWSRLLPAMRRMELAGELTAGLFFSGVNSLQFASPRIAEELEEAEAEQGIYWMNAADPASPAGLAVEGIVRGKGDANVQTPRRVSSSRLCFRGADLLAVGSRGGKELEIFIPPEDPGIARALEFLKIPRTRKVQPENKISVEKINGESAAKSPYAAVLVSLGFVKDRLKLILW